MTTVSDVTEQDLIGRIRRRFDTPAPPWLVVGIGDDAAVVAPERNRLEVFTVDACVEGVHFDRAFTPPGAIGHRAVAASLSDLAAMGAAPRFALLSLALPSTLGITDFDALIEGIAVLAGAHGARVIGGNLTRSPGPLMLDITAAGTVKPRSVLRRSGAAPGDAIYVTGSVGSAAAGLEWLGAGSPAGPAPSMESCAARYLSPEPRVRAGLLVGRTRAASACMDLSDGLSDALQQVTMASGVGATIDASALPIETAARVWFEARGRDPIDAAMAGGDDYELLFTVPAARRRRFLAAVRLSGTPAVRIGVCTKEPGCRFGEEPGRAPAQGFTHFR